MKKLLLLFALSAFFPLVMAQAGVKHETESGMLYSVAVFGTAGYSITDKPYRYSRTTEHGGFSQLSRFGAQFEADFSPRLSFTLQGEFAPSTYKDHRYHPHLSWAFLTFRPTNNWTIQLGKVRMPMMIHAQNMPVGVSYVQSQLPLEIYGTTPVYDLIGGIVGYTWNLKQNQALTLEGYAGFTNSHIRIFYRGGVPNFKAENSVYYLPFQTPIYGGSLYWQDFENDRQARVKLFYASLRRRHSDSKMWGKNPARFVEYAPGKFSYTPTPGYDGGLVYDRMPLIFLTFGVNWHLGNEWYFVGEGVFRHSLKTNVGLNSLALYAMVSKRYGKWTPYVSLSAIQPATKIRSYLKEMGQPTGNHQLDLLNMSAADNLVTMQQWAFTLGAAYDIAPNQRLKFAWIYTHIGRASALLSARADQDFKHKGINMFNISYNFLFNF